MCVVLCDLWLVVDWVWSGKFGVGFGGYFRGYWDVDVGLFDWIVILDFVCDWLVCFVWRICFYICWFFFWNGVGVVVDGNV